MDETSDNGLLFARRLNGDGTGTAITWKDVDRWTSKDGPIWIHLDRTNPNVKQWLREKSGLTKITVDALLTEESRPRAFRGKRGTIAVLRGIDLNPDAKKGDMVDLRIWSEGKRVITLRSQHLQSVRDILAELGDQGDGPSTISDLFETIVSRLNERIAPTIEEFEARIDDIELHLDLGEASALRRKLMDLRSEAVTLRRYLSPQRVALSELVASPPDWADEHWQPRMREYADTLMRFIEELDAASERALVIKDDIANQLAESTNRTLYALAVISGVFLPLAFLTGLLGINIGGIPGVDDQRAFWIFCAGLLVTTALEIVIFKKMKWL